MSTSNIEQFFGMYNNENKDNFSNLLKKTLNKLNTTRKKLLLKGLISELIVLLVLIVTYYGYYHTTVIMVSKLCIYLFAIALILFLSVPMFIITGYREKVLIAKGDIYKNIKNINYQNNKELFSNDEIYKSKLFGYYDKNLPLGADGYIGEPITIDDTFSGKYKNISFKIEEIQLNKSFPILYSRTGVSYLPLMKLFRGVIIVFEFDKAVKSTTIIASKKDLFIKNSRLLYILKTCLFLLLLFISVLLCIFYNKFVIAGIAMFITIPLLLYVLFSIVIFLINTALVKQDKKLHKLTFEDHILEKKYNAYSEDPVKGRCLLTSDFREKFLNLTTAFGSDKAKCSFYDKKLMIAISTGKNLFEFGNIFTEPKADRFFKELISILYLIDYFNFE